MRDAWSRLATVGLLGILGGPGRAEAQGVGFSPTVGQASDGVAMSVTPAVSADRRYVRLSVGVAFQTVDGFSNFPVPAAASGGGGRGIGGGLGGALGGAGGGGVLTGMNGPIGTGTGQAGAGYAFVGPGDEFYEDLGAWRPPARKVRSSKAKSVRPKGSSAAPTVASAKKKP